MRVEIKKEIWSDVTDFNLYITDSTNEILKAKVSIINIILNKI
jgi:hypothetical protein